jgi:hypothetical protein
VKTLVLASCTPADEAMPPEHLAASDGLVAAGAKGAAEVAATADTMDG